MAWLGGYYDGQIAEEETDVQKREVICPTWPNPYSVCPASKCILLKKTSQNKMYSFPLCSIIINLKHVETQIKHLALEVKFFSLASDLS